ncbi:MAG: hypothetical protein IPN85_11800 [Flavobacteriales bacterium]|nr:hypothetical protein [Flavobacteriales bacterium]MBK9288597.1 hypothetical protein [Flavobacteriales bacterium]MBL0036344.1 hypothetical protein [Flavobacteriales bacterium]
MKRLSFLLFSVIIMPFATMAQFAVNPQLGITMQKLTDAPEGAEYKAALGAMIGLDMRIGDRFYFQPGGFFERNSTVVSVGDSLVVEDNLVRSNLKLKALVGYNLIDGDGFRLRFNTGPTYDVLLSVDDKDDKIEWNKDDFNSGSFNWNAGLGADITIITLETGMTYGLSKVFKEQDGFTSDAKYFTFYVTAGVVFGGANK